MHAPRFRIVPSARLPAPGNSVLGGGQLLLLTSQLVHLHALRPREIFRRLLKFLTQPPSALHSYLHAVDIGGHAATQKLPACAIVFSDEMAASTILTKALKDQIARVLELPPNLLGVCFFVDSADLLQTPEVLLHPEPH